MRALDLIGQVFGLLTVVSRAENSKEGKTRWLCRCVCGGSRTAVACDLKAGKTSSCGCNYKKAARVRKLDLSGKTYGRLTVLKGVTHKRGRARWLCSCSCGIEKEILQGQLVSGKTQSCGCLRSEVVAARAVERNTTHGLTGTPAYVLHMSRKRQLSKVQRTPPWSEEEKILEFYANCPGGHHVDHIIPLNGALVSGLHVLGNLQYLPAKVNLQKKNKFTPYTELSRPMAV